MSRLFPHVPRQNLRYLALLLIPALAILPLPDFWITQLNYIGLYSLVSMGLVLLTGVGGLTSFGQAAFVGIGAYTSAYLTVNMGMSPWVTVFAGLAITAVSALMVGWLTLRMSGHYLPLATIAWGLSLYYLMGNLDALGKYDGILGVPALSVGGLDLSSGRPFFSMVWCMVFLGAFALLNLLDSRTGRAIRSLKSATQMAEAMGVNTLQHKIGIFLIAALFASVSGWLFAHFQRTVNPSPFGLKMGIEYLFMAVLGGIGHVWGAITGALFTKVMEDQLQVLLPQLIGTSGSYEVIVFGIVLVLVLKYLPDGSWSLVGRHFPVPQRVNTWFKAEALPERSKPALGEVVLDVQKVRKQFGGLVAVNDISFQIKAGQIVGLIGPNGAGKSTTFNLITGVLGLTSGAVKFRGEVISGIPSREIALRGMSRTFQHVKMIPDMTVLENVALGAHLRGNKGALAAMLRLDREEENRPPTGAHRHGRPHARPGRQPGHGAAAADGNCPRPVLRPGLAAARRARCRPASQRKAGPGWRAAPTAWRRREHFAGGARHGPGDGRDRPHRGDGVRHPPDGRHPARGAAKRQGARRVPGHGTLIGHP